jgi:hypothetical protein
MKGYLHRMLSGPDNATPDVARVLGVIAFLFYLGYYGVAAARGQQIYAPGELGLGIAGMLVAVGGAVRIKASTEPGAN